MTNGFKWEVGGGGGGVAVPLAPLNLPMEMVSTVPTKSRKSGVHSDALKMGRGWQCIDGEGGGGRNFLLDSPLKFWPI